VLATTILVAPDRCSVDNDSSPLQSQTPIAQRRKDRCQAVLPAGLQDTFLYES